MKKNELLDVYCNIHKKCISTLHTSGPRYGRLFRHANHVLIRNAVFRVRQGTRQKAVKTKTRSVHAFCRGEVDFDYDVAPLVNRHDAVRVRYQPFVRGEFFRPDTGESVYSADMVVIIGKFMVAFNPNSSGPL